MRACVCACVRAYGWAYRCVRTCVCVGVRTCVCGQSSPVNGKCSTYSLTYFLILIQILIEHLKAVTPSSKMITLLPKSVATVQKREASLPLHHLITVEGSWPTARCYLTCEVGPRSVESTGVKPNTAQTGDGSTLETNGPTEHQQHGKEAGSLYTEGQWGMITCALVWVLRLQLCMSLAFKFKSRFDLK